MYKFRYLGIQRILDLLNVIPSVLFKSQGELYHTRFAELYDHGMSLA